MANVQAQTSTSTDIAVTWIPDANSRQTGFKVSYRVRIARFEMNKINALLLYWNAFRCNKLSVCPRINAYLSDI